MSFACQALACPANAPRARLPLSLPGWNNYGLYSYESLRMSSIGTSCTVVRSSASVRRFTSRSKMALSRRLSALGSVAVISTQCESTTSKNPVSRATCTDVSDMCEGVRVGSLQAWECRFGAMARLVEKCGGGRDKAMTGLGGLRGPRVHATIRNLRRLLRLSKYARTGRQCARRSSSV